MGFIDRMDETERELVRVFFVFLKDVTRDKSPI